MRSLLSFSLALLYCSSVHADDTLSAKIEEIIDRPEYAQAHWGILVVEPKSGKVLYERNAERLFTPASTAKLFSCATALAAYGPDYRFKTPVYRHGEIKDGVLHGDLLLVASGDLTFGGRTGKDGKTLFTTNDHTYANSGNVDAEVTDSNPVRALDELAKQVVRAGIEEVDGEILVDDRLFSRSRGTGSGPDLLTPMIVNDNVIDILVAPGKKPGEPASVRIRPETAYYHLDADVATSAADKPTRLTLQASTSTNFSLRGEIAVNGRPTVRIFHVDEPRLFARALFIEALRRHGVRCMASLYRPAHFELPSKELRDKWPRIAEYTSEPFAEAIAVTLKVSHNLYASTLPLLVAVKHGEHTLDRGLRQQGIFLKGIGVPVQTISFGGGAGGSNADAVTPEATVKLLQAMAKRPEADAYFNALPTLGVDGTLADVVSADSPARGKVQAKTGTLLWYDLMNDRSLLRSKALAGTLKTANGSKLFFAMFLNDLPLPPGVPASREGKVLGKLCEIIHFHGP